MYNRFKEEMQEKLFFKKCAIFAIKRKGSICFGHHHAYYYNNIFMCKI